ncbi:MAG: hypothetical protein NUV97_01140 [archaeon]|nr:hypothetical protein [archaeon]MCR4323433.1 hypothetical protein [Nanoarchaeota archaeon]
MFQFIKGEDKNMKKKLILLVFVFLLILPIIFAQESDPPVAGSGDSGESVVTDGEGVNLVDKSKELGSNLFDKSKVSFPIEISVPKWMQSGSEIIFKVTSGDNLSIFLFIVLIGIFIIVFSILQNVIHLFTPSSGTISSVVSLVFTLVLSFFGIIKSLALSLFSFKSESLGTFPSILVILGAIGLCFLLHIVVNKVVRKKKIGDAIDEGTAAGTQMSKLKAMAEVQEVVNDGTMGPP